MIYLRYALALHPEVQEELYQSIIHEVKGDVTYDHLKQLKFLDATIKESQRLFTINPIMGRDCDENTVVGGIPIEKVS